MDQYRERETPRPILGQTHPCILVHDIQKLTTRKPPKPGYGMTPIIRVQGCTYSIYSVINIEWSLTTIKSDPACNIEKASFKFLETDSSLLKM